MINRMVGDSFIELFICFGMSTITSIFQNEEGLLESALKSIKEVVEGGWEGALEEGEESGCRDSCCECEVQRLIINNVGKFCGVTKILDKEVTMSGFSTFTLEPNCVSEFQCLHSFLELRCTFLSEQKALFSLWEGLLN